VGRRLTAFTGMPRAAGRTPLNALRRKPGPTLGRRRSSGLEHRPGSSARSTLPGWPNGYTRHPRDAHTTVRGPRDQSGLPRLPPLNPDPRVGDVGAGRAGSNLVTDHLPLVRHHRPGRGCGKTRLAVEVAHWAATAVRRRSSRFVGPQPLRAARSRAGGRPRRPLELLVPALGNPRGRAARAGPANRPGASLLVLDNCKHVLNPVGRAGRAGAGRRGEVRRAGPSREPARPRGEHVPSASAVGHTPGRAVLRAVGSRTRTPRQGWPRIVRRPTACPSWRSRLGAGRARVYSLDEIATTHGSVGRRRLSHIGRGRPTHQRSSDAVGTAQPLATVPRYCQP
jgi:hypothetical protein